MHRSFRLSYVFTALLLLLIFMQAQAQTSNSHQLLAMATPVTTAPSRPTMMTLTGRVETTTGVLPGAVVAVHGGQHLRTVTDADGLFRLVLPATKEPIAVTTSYAGYSDLTTSIVPNTLPPVLRLVPSHEIKLPHKQQLKTCLRVARKQIKHELKQVHS